MTELVRLDRDGPHVVLTLNRPDKLNALSYALVDLLLARLDALEDDDGVRAIVLTGAGCAPSVPGRTSLTLRRTSKPAPTVPRGASSRAARR
jgi:hypothetical protein